MEYGFPDTTEKRKAGMASFRAQMLKTHERNASNPKLPAKERAYQQSLVDTIKAAQRKFGEVA